MRIRFGQVNFFICSVFVLMFGNVRVFAQIGQITETGQNLTLDVQDRRPLAKAAEVLERKYGWHINYEDPRDLPESDILDVTDPAFRLTHPDQRALIPRGGRILLTYPIPPNTKRPGAADVLQALLAAHNRSGSGAVFELRRIPPNALIGGEVFQIVPAQVRNNKGQFSVQLPILDIPITFVEQDRTAGQTIRLICSTVALLANVKVGFVNMAPNFFSQKRVQIGAKNENARDVLFRALASTGSKFAWRLLYAPDLKTYHLNLHEVVIERTGPDGARILSPAQ